MNSHFDEELMHYGTPRHSGRYPWGSGDDPYQRCGDFISRVTELRKSGIEETEIAKAVGCKSTTELRSLYSNAVNDKKTIERDRIKSLLSDGNTTAEISRIMNIPPSTVRSMMNTQAATRSERARVTADVLRNLVSEKGMIDVGSGTEYNLGISKTKLNQALKILEDEGYPIYKGSAPQVTNPGNMTHLKILCPIGTPHRDIFAFKDGKPNNIHTVVPDDYIIRKDKDGNDIADPAFAYPKSMDSKRVAIRYAEDGGLAKDGVVEIRRGVEDLSLGDRHYAQVRILVDDKSYIKGMAMYSDNVPDGYDVIFNTNKTKDVPKEKVFKPIKDDPDNPFGALIKEHGGQSYYYDKDGNRQLSLINKTRDEGDWQEWKNGLPSQFLSKQPLDLIKKQLNLAQADKIDEFDDICSVNNPTIKKRLLESFADDCDSAAVDLQAASLPKQSYHVILPIDSLKDNEVFAPKYNDGDTLALIRYPHAGTFEIPILKVNNKNKEGLDDLTNSCMDAIGINSKVAARLSGADFDGDTVMAIPCNSSTSSIKIVSTPALKQLEGFDPHMEYAIPEGNPDHVKLMTKTGTQTEMGKISNLITDMTLRGANIGDNSDEIARAVKHSMVVIDAYKHELDYKRSESQNGIAALKKKYQGRVDEDGRYHDGASTLISRSKGEKEVLKRQGMPKINEVGKSYYDPSKPEGSLIWNSVEEEYKVFKKLKDPETGKYLIDPDTRKVLKVDTGKTKFRTQKSYQMSDVDDAFELSSGTPQETAYATFANKMKALANEARKEKLRTGNIVYSASAREVYSNEVQSLDDKLAIACQNAPRERQAQLIANSELSAKKLDNPDMTTKEIKKAGQMALTKARNLVGAKRTPIEINDREWEAIQAGAITETKLRSILDHADIDALRERATPRSTTVLSDARVAKISAMKASGYTIAQIAESVGCSSSTVSKYMNGKMK